MMYKFTSRAEKAIAYSQEIAAELGHNYVGTFKRRFWACV